MLKGEKTKLRKISTTITSFTRKDSVSRVSDLGLGLAATGSGAASGRASVSAMRAVWCARGTTSSRSPVRGFSACMVAFSPRRHYVTAKQKRSTPMPADWTPIEALPSLRLESLFADDPDRLKTLSLDIAGLHFDWSKTHLTAQALTAFQALAKAQDLAGKRE